MTPSRHQHVQCPLAPASMVSLLPVTKGRCWGGPWLPREQKEEGSAVPAGASSPCLLCGPSQWIPSPYLSRARAKGDTGPHKAPGCQHPPGTHHCRRDTLHPMAALRTWTPAESSATLQPREGSQPFPTGPAVTRAWPRHSLLCGGLFVGFEREKYPGRGSHPQDSSPAWEGQRKVGGPGIVVPSQHQQWGWAWVQPEGDIMGRHGAELGQWH